jgi:hypothetical protein
MNAAPIGGIIRRPQSALRVGFDAMRAGIRAARDEVRAARFASQPVVQDRLAEMRAGRSQGIASEGIDSRAAIGRRIEKLQG